MSHLIKLIISVIIDASLQYMVVAAYVLLLQLLSNIKGSKKIGTMIDCLLLHVPFHL